MAQRNNDKADILCKWWLPVGAAMFDGLAVYKASFVCGDGAGGAGKK